MGLIRIFSIRQTAHAFRRTGHITHARTITNPLCVFGRGAEQSAGIKRRPVGPVSSFQGDGELEPFVYNTLPRSLPTISAASALTLALMAAISTVVRNLILRRHSSIYPTLRRGSRARAPHGSFPRHCCPRRSDLTHGAHLGAQIPIEPLLSLHASHTAYLSHVVRYVKGKVQSTESDPRRPASRSSSRRWCTVGVVHCRGARPRRAELG
jgi:hypothetical protein